MKSKSSKIGTIAAGVFILLFVGRVVFAAFQQRVFLREKIGQKFDCAMCDEW